MSPETTPNTTASTDAAQAATDDVALRSAAGAASDLAAVATRRAAPGDIEALPFDVYQRYRLVADLVDELFGSAGATVLDVGGRTGILRRFLPAREVALVDVEASTEGGLVCGDGSRLPFRSAAFDVVVACDTLEHVAPERRDAFVDDCARVARRAVVLAGPYQSERVAEAEETLRAYLHDKLDVEHRFLDEHRANGLPSRAGTERRLEAAGLRVTSLGHGNLERWLALLSVSMYMERDRHLKRVAEHAYRFYNRALYDSDVRAPVYRHAVVATRGGLVLPRVEDVLRVDAAPEGAVEPFVHLAAELFAFDRERDVYDAERNRLQSVIDGLVCDLDGHKRVMETLETDLDGHRRVVDDLATDLDGHRVSLEGLRVERDRELASLSAHQDLVEALRREVAVLRRYGTDLEGEARRANELADEVNARYAAAHRENDALRAELRSRWKSLGRVFFKRRA